MASRILVVRVEARAENSSDETLLDLETVRNTEGLLLQHVQQLAWDLLPGASQIQATYLDDEGDQCTLTETTTKDALSFASAHNDLEDALLLVISVKGEHSQEQPQGEVQPSATEASEDAADSSSSTEASIEDKAASEMEEGVAQACQVEAVPEAEESVPGTADESTMKCDDEHISLEATADIDLELHESHQESAESLPVSRQIFPGESAESQRVDVVQEASLASSGEVDVEQAASSSSPVDVEVSDCNFEHEASSTCPVEVDVEQATSSSSPCDAEANDSSSDLAQLAEEVQEARSAEQAAKQHALEVEALAEEDMKRHLDESAKYIAEAEACQEAEKLANKRAEQAQCQADELIRELELLKEMLESDQASRKEVEERLEAALSSSEEVISTLRADIESQKQFCTAAEEDLAAEKSRSDSLNELMSSYHTQAQKLGEETEEVQRLGAELAKVREELQASQLKSDELASQCTAIQQVAASEQQASSDEIERLSQELAIMAEKRAAETERLGEAADESAHAKEEISQLQGVLEASSLREAEMQEELASLRSSIKEAHSDLSTEKAKVEQLAKVCAEEKEGSQKLDQDAQVLRESQAELQDRLSAATEEAAQFQSKVADLEQELENLRSRSSEREADLEIRRTAAENEAAKEKARGDELLEKSVASEQDAQKNTADLSIARAFIESLETLVASVRRKAAEESESLQKELDDARNHISKVESARDTAESNNKEAQTALQILHAELLKTIDRAVQAEQLVLDLQKRKVHSPALSALVHMTDDCALTLGIEAEEVATARGDITKDMSEQLAQFGARQAFRIGRVRLPATFAEVAPACARVVVKNDGVERWPQTTVIVHVDGEHFGLQVMALGSVNPGETKEIEMDLEVRSHTGPAQKRIYRPRSTMPQLAPRFVSGDARTELRSTWAIMDAASGTRLGPMLVFEAVWDLP